MGVFISGIGIVPILGLAYLLSTNRKAILWRPVVGGVFFQLVFAVLILKTSWGHFVFEKVGDVVMAFLRFSDEGARFVFGEQFTAHPFAFQVLSVIIFFSSFMSLLYYFGVMQWVVKLFAKMMVKVMNTSGAESLSASANIFVGMTEAPLLIKPFVAKMTESELMAVMTCGFATIAGSVMAAYISFGVSAGHLLAASVMSAPAALAIAKIMVPETEVSLTMGKVSVPVEKTDSNMIEAAANGAGVGLKLALNVGAMLLAFIAIIALGNAVFGWFGDLIGFPKLTLEYLFGWLGWPIAFVIGVPFSECHVVGSLIGQKVLFNEFIAYKGLSEAMATGLSPRAQYLATYALCGFSNFSSIAIQIGGIGGIAPERKSDLARIGLRAMIAGNLACFMTANIAGLFI